jgi:hypothetical protein
VWETGVEYQGRLVNDYGEGARGRGFCGRAYTRLRTRILRALHLVPVRRSDETMCRLEVGHAGRHHFRTDAEYRRFIAERWVASQNKRAERRQRREDVRTLRGR